MYEVYIKRGLVVVIYNFIL